MGERTARKTLLPVCILLMLLLTAANAKAVSFVLTERIMLCLHTLIPSLYGCMVLGNLMQMSGCGAWLGARLRLLYKLLRMPEAAVGIFLVSQLAGYPVGMILLRRAAETGSISREDAARLSPCCFGGGPAFLVGLAGAKLFGSAAAGWVMLGACICANLVLARAVGRHGRPSAQPAVCCTCSAQMLTDAVAAAVRSLAMICGTVLLFGVLTALTEQLGITELPVRGLGLLGIPRRTALALLHTLTDVSLLPELFYCGLPFHILLPLTAGLLSFGGLCVHCQCLAAGGGLCSVCRLFGMRLLAALLTAALTAAAVPLVPLPDVSAVFSVQAALSESRSPIPALLIFFTGFPFLLKKD